MQIRTVAVAAARLRNIVVPVLVMLAFPLHPTSLRAEEVEVRIANFAFEPATLTVKAGTKVTWENYDDSPHSIVSPRAGFRSRALDTEDTAAFTFATPGTFDYICGLHPQMKGTISVLP